MNSTQSILDHLSGEDAARKFLRQVADNTAPLDGLWLMLAGLPQSQRRGACRLIQRQLESPVLHRQIGK